VGAKEPIMPTNLPPEYYEAEKEYRAAESPAEKVSTLEALIATIPKHKGTDKLRADLRRRLSKLKSAAQSRKSLSTHESAYHIDKEGAGQVVLVGAPNVGKSALVAALTNAAPEVANFPHSTWTPTPGMMPVENVQIQLIDTPPLNREYVEPDLLDLIRRADLMLLVVDLLTDPVQQLQDSAAFLEEHHIAACHRREQYAEQRRLIFIPCLVLANKYDDERFDENFEIFCALLNEEWPLLPVSATTGRNLERLKRRVFETLRIIRVYTKAPDQEPDFTAPFILKKGDTVLDLAGKIHKDFVEQLKTARIWGQGVYDGQLVKRDHVLHDGDVVELHV
jgi:ribosome-interacting GTPase 1